MRLALQSTVYSRKIMPREQQSSPRPPDEVRAIGLRFVAYAQYFLYGHTREGVYPLNSSSFEHELKIVRRMTSLTKDLREGLPVNVYKASSVVVTNKSAGGKSIDVLELLPAGYNIELVRLPHLVADTARIMGFDPFKMSAATIRRVFPIQLLQDELAIQVPIYLFQTDSDQVDLTVKELVHKVGLACAVHGQQDPAAYSQVFLRKTLGEDLKK